MSSVSVDVVDERVEVRDSRVLPLQVERDVLDVLPSPSHVVVYLALLKLAGSEAAAAPGIAGIAKVANVSKATIKRCLPDLERLGILVGTRMKSANGMKGRTLYRVLGTDAVMVGSNRANGGMAQSELSRLAQSAPSGDAGTKLNLSHQCFVAVEDQQQETTERLVAAGVARRVAMELARADEPECARQLRALPGRTPSRNPAGMLVKAIREQWPVSEPVAGAVDGVVQAAREPCVECDGLGLVDSPDQPDAMAFCYACRIG